MVRVRIEQRRCQVNEKQATWTDQTIYFYQRNEGTKCSTLLFGYFGLIILGSFPSHTKNKN